jgi:amphi-Trp domain-containing protein
MAKEGMQNMELKETLDRNRFLEMLQGWTRAIEQNQDFEVRVNGQSHTIPADAIDRGRLRVEYEIDRGEYEFELTLKWR